MSEINPFPSETRSVQAAPGAVVPTNPSSSEGGLGDVWEYVHGVRRRWKLVVLVVLLVLAAALVHFAITPPVYTATTMLQIDRRSPTSGIGPQTAWLDYMYNMEYYPTQYKLLESRGMAERVVRDLRLADRRRGGRSGGAVGDGSADGDRTAFAKLADRIRSGLSVHPIKGTQLVQLTYRSSRPEDAALLANGYAQTFIDWGIETRSGLVDKTSTALDTQIADLQEEVAELETELRSFSRDEQLDDFNPDASATLQRLEDLNRQVMEATRERIDKEAHYEELRRLPQETVAQMSTVPVEEQVNEQRRLEREYETKLLTYTEDWPPMQELRDRMEEGRRNLDRVISAEAAKVLAAARAEYQAARRQELQLEAEAERLKEQMLTNSPVAVRYNSLQMEASSHRELLDQLLKQQSETEVAVRLQSSNESNVRVVDEALVPGRPSQPSFPRSLGAGVFGGLFLGLGFALALEFFDRSIKSSAEVERLLGLSVLAVVPDVGEEGAAARYGAYAYGERGSRRHGGGRRQHGPSKTARGWLEKRASEGAAAPTVELIPHHRPRSAVSENYRALRTALLLSSAEKLSLVAVTSAGASEGKTVTASNLGTVMAQLDRRVLLVDADLRKPRLHKVFGVSNRVGLVSYLTGGARLEEAIVPTAVPNLWVLPSGPIPPNPSELLGSQRMQEFLAGARERFDFVLLDTPPALAVTDATILGAEADGVVLCLRAGEVTRDEARTCRDRLQRADVKILGVVLNGLRSNTAGYRYRKDQAYYAAYGEEAGGSAA